MTVIQALLVDRIVLRFRAPLRYGTQLRDHQDVAIIRVRADDGSEGVGELLVGPSADLERLHASDRARAVGQDPDVLARVHDWALGGGLEWALMDLEAQRSGRPLTAILRGWLGLRPGGSAMSVAVNGLLTVGEGSPDEAAARALALVDGGHGTLKIKRAIGVQEVTPHLTAIRDAVGAAVQLRLDLNGELDPADAASWLVRLSAVRLEYVEQPISARHGPAALARLRRQVPMPLAADEAVTGGSALTGLVAHGACDVVVLKPARVGGPAVAVDLVSRAHDAGMGVTISTLYESGVGIAAALHLAASLPGDRAHGLGTGELLEDDLVGDALRVTGGRMRLPAGPGLGARFAPRPDVVTRSR